MLISRALAFAAASLAFLPAASGEEGMWTFDNFPAARMQTEMGWAPDRAWLDRAMAGTARLPGCSAASVSVSGLVLTNQHCIIACLTALSAPGRDYLTAGFAAAAPEAELRCPGLSVEMLTGIEDATGRIETAAAQAAPEAFARVRDAEVARIERACAGDGVRCQVVTLYNGARYALYRYRAFTDVRLVFAPEHAMAAFGGEADNFSFPRHCIDFAFLRVYEGGAPAATPHHLSLRFTPVQEAEVVLISGNPGYASRLRTLAELEFERDLGLPWTIAAERENLARLRAHAALGPDQARNAAAALQSAENALVILDGRLRALADGAGLAEAAARERDLQARVSRNQAAARDAGQAWAEIARAHAAYAAMFERHQLLEAGAGGHSQLFAWARDLVRAAAERQRPEGERLARYGAARLNTVMSALAAPLPVDRGVEAAHLEAWLIGVQRRLGGADDLSFRQVLGEETPAELARRLAQSQLADREFRMQMWAGAAEAVAASDDPMIVFVRGWDREARAVRAEHAAAFAAPVARARERIARARFRAFGDRLYPDATFSPRLSYGRVLGWTEADGRQVTPFTRVSDLYARAGDGPPLALSPAWAAARERLDPNTIFNLASSNDLIAGNSGSAMLDRDGRVVGVVFDGNTHSLGGEYFYDGARNRGVAVSAAIIRAALAEVYSMPALVDELEGR